MFADIKVVLEVNFISMSLNILIRVCHRDCGGLPHVMCVPVCQLAWWVS